MSRNPRQDLARKRRLRRRNEACHVRRRDAELLVRERLQARGPHFLLARAAPTTLPQGPTGYRSCCRRYAGASRAAPDLQELDSGFLREQLQGPIAYELHAYQTSPSVLYRPTVKRDGSKWCALLGENLQVGVAGFGDSPEWEAAGPGLSGVRCCLACQGLNRLSGPAPQGPARTPTGAGPEAV